MPSKFSCPCLQFKHDSFPAQTLLYHNNIDSPRTSSPFPNSYPPRPCVILSSLLSLPPNFSTLCHRTASPFPGLLRPLHHPATVLVPPLTLASSHFELGKSLARCSPPTSIFTNLRIGPCRGSPFQRNRWQTNDHFRQTYLPTAYLFRNQLLHRSVRDSHLPCTSTPALPGYLGYAAAG